MPPQPLSKIRPNIGFSLTAEGFEKRPHVAVAIAQCIASWSWVDTQFGRMFMGLLGANREAGAALWNDLKGAGAKDSAFRTIALCRLDPEDFEIALAIIKMKKSNQGVRDKIAHWFWGYSEEVDDGMVIVNPQKLLAQQGRFMDAMMPEKPITPANLGLSKADIYVYRISDLVQDDKDFRHLAHLINNFGGLIPDKDIRLQRRHELETDARLKTFVDQVRNPQSGQSPSKPLP